MRRPSSGSRRQTGNVLPFPISHRLYLACGVLMLISELWKQWTLTFRCGGGVYNWWYFPFQLCSIPMYVCLAVGITDSARLRTFLADFGMLGGIFVFCDTSGMHYAYFPLTVHSYAWHVLLILLGIISGLETKTDRSRKGYLHAALLYLACCAVATVINLTCYSRGVINMFYISPRYPMTQKFFVHIAEFFGNEAGIAGYILASMFGAGLFHALWYFLRRGILHRSQD